jgi:HK97 family phage prohead protease
VTVLSIDEFRAELRQGRQLAGPVQRLTVAEALPIGDPLSSRTVTFCLSDGSVDRMGDTIDPHGWELAAYRRNPVVLWAHDAMSPPIGLALNIRAEGERLMGDIEFAGEEVYPFADQIYRLVRARFLNACSVGFNPLEWSWSRDKDREFGIDFNRQEMLEVSVVPVPANANALVIGRAARAQIARSGDLGRSNFQSPPAPKWQALPAIEALDPMPPGFCGVWADYQRQRRRRDTQQQIARLLRIELRSRPRTSDEVRRTCGRIAELCALEEAWR